MKRAALAAAHPRPGDPMDITMEMITNIVNMMVILIVALTFHEAAHAYVATWQGDSTPRLAGRLTLNPVPHIDPMGTLVLPGIMLAMSAASGMGFIFGWAKPVPVDTRQFKDGRWGDILVSAAGPGANLLLCTLGVLIAMVIMLYFPDAMAPGQWGEKTRQLLLQFSAINAFLAFLNLIPLPPLDGSHILRHLLPDQAREFFDTYITPYSFMIFMVLMISGNLGFIYRFAMVYMTLSQRLCQNVLALFV